MIEQSEYALIRRRSLRRMRIAAAVSAVAATVLLTLAIELWRPILFPPEVAVTDPRMEKGCKLPRYEGQFTGFAVIDGKIICWIM